MSTGKVKVLCLALSAMVIAISLLSCTRGKGPSVPSDRSPDFALSDIKGNELRLSDLTGKVVMLEFWATWCPPCVDSIPDMNALHEKYKDRGFVLLGISMDKGESAKERVEASIKEHSIAYRVLIDDKDVNSLYGVFSIPTSFIIDKNGKLVGKHIGFNPGIKEILSREIEALL